MKMTDTKKEISVNKVLLIENLLKNFEGSIISLNNLKKKLPKDIPSKSLKTALEYLENSNKIVYTSKGITWMHNESPKLRKAIKHGMSL